MFSSGNQIWTGRRHTEETKQKMREAAMRRRQIKSGVLPMPVAPEKKVRGWAWKGRKHTAETRRRMSEAHGRRSGGGRGIVCHTPEEGYRLLIMAVICRAIKDKAVEFFYTDTGKNYCDLAGVDPDKLLEKYNAQRTRTA
jgi:hypothetical protein